MDLREPADLDCANPSPCTASTNRPAAGGAVPSAAEPGNLRPDAELLRWMRLVGAGVGFATFLGYDASDRFLVRRDGDGEALPAASTLALRDGDVGCRVVIACEGGDDLRPVVVGRLQTRPGTCTGTMRLDGERLLLQAERDLELRCGEASIVLTRAGKVLIKGTYVVSRSSGANRIKGACVDIN